MKNLFIILFLFPWLGCVPQTPSKYDRLQDPKINLNTTKNTTSATKNTAQDKSIDTLKIKNTSQDKSIKADSTAGVAQNVSIANLATTISTQTSKQLTQNTAFQTQLAALQKTNDSLKNLVNQYKTKLDLNQFTIGDGVASITQLTYILNLLINHETRIKALEIK